MAKDPRDYKVELSAEAQRATGRSPGPTPSGSSATPTDSASPVGATAGGAGRPFLSVHFACCGAYQRVYRSPDGTHYAGRCPRCGKPVRFAVGEGGTSARSFTVM